VGPPVGVLSAHDAITLTENHIRQRHRDLLAHSTRDERHRGSYMTHPNPVEAFDQNGTGLGGGWTGTSLAIGRKYVTLDFLTFVMAGHDPAIHAEPLGLAFQMLELASTRGWPGRARPGETILEAIILQRPPSPVRSSTAIMA
jgi:hypothetical protein